MPFDESDEVGFSHACGIGPDGHWHGRVSIHIRAEALSRLGLHPDQPSSKITRLSPPAWWHAAAERAFHQRYGGRG